MQKENNGRKAALQLSSKADAVTFFGVFGGRKTFLLRYRNSDKYCMIEGDKCVVNGTKRFSLTEDQAARFRAAEGNFLRELDDATMGKGGFGSAEYGGNTLYFRRLEGNEYMFIARYYGGDIRADKRGIYDYLFSFGCVGAGKFGCGKGDIGFGGVPVPFESMTSTPDEYLNRETRYLCGEATEDDVHFLAHADGVPRFVPVKDVYGTEDFTVLKAEHVPRTFLNHVLRYRLTVLYEGAEYKACFYPSSTKIMIEADNVVTPCAVTSELQDEIYRVIAAGGGVHPR